MMGEQKSEGELFSYAVNLEKRVRPRSNWGSRLDEKLGARTRSMEGAVRTSEEQFRVAPQGRVKKI